jgi:hypothetical protein
MRSVDSESVVVVGSFAGELLCVGEEASVLASGDLTDSLSLSCGHSFLICLRMFASARDPELDSVRPEFNSNQSVATDVGTSGLTDQ